MRVQKRMERMAWFTLVFWITMTVAGAGDRPMWAFMYEAVYRNITGSLLFLLLLSQWALSMGRLVYQLEGARWDRWVKVHERLAMWIPLAALIHFVQLGYGLLGVLPFLLIGSLIFGAWLASNAPEKKWLPYHMTFAALTLATSLVHLWRVVFFR